MPNRRKLPHFKAIEGTEWRRDRVYEPGVTFPLLEVPPSPPKWLPNAAAVAEWHRLGAYLVRLRVLTEAGLGPLAMLCSMHGTIAQMWSAGSVPAAGLISQHRLYLGDFGLTPALAAAPFAKVGADADLSCNDVLGITS